MSELLDDLEVGFPKTVTACHAELRRLEGLLSDADKQLDQKEEKIVELQSEIDDDDGDEESGGDAVGAIHSFLDECERTGPLRYDVPQTESAQRAIVALHDAVGRTP